MKIRETMKSGGRKLLLDELRILASVESIFQL
jgi:hypothetical protein